MQLLIHEKKISSMKDLAAFAFEQTAKMTSRC